MDNVTLFGQLISYSRICVNGRYFILKEYPDRISLQHIYFLPNGVEDHYKNDYTVLTPDQLISLLYMKNDLFVIKNQEEADLICNEGSI